MSETDWDTTTPDYYPSLLGLNETLDMDLVQSVINLTLANQSSSIQVEGVSGPLIITCYLLIIVVSLCGNILVCKVAFTQKDMRTTTNMLIASLACSDIVMTSFNIPFNVARLLLLDWPFGQLLCFLVPFVQTSCVYVSTFTMTVIAVHRLWTITQKRTSHTFSAVKIVFTVIVIWLLAGSLSLPHAGFNRLTEVVMNGERVVRCRPNYPKFTSFNFPLFLSVEVFITQYVLPLSVTMVVYIKIGFIIAKQGKLIGKLSDERKRRQSEAKRRRIFMLALAVATFAVCWFPINFYYLLVDFKFIKHHLSVFLICHWFAMSSVCYNPFIYCWLNEKFRNGAKQSIQSIRQCVMKCIDVPKSRSDVGRPGSAIDLDTAQTEKLDVRSRTTQAQIDTT